MKPKIAKVVVGLPVDGPFDYSIGTNLRGRIAVGQRVRVSFNHQNRAGFVVGSTDRSAFKKLNPILSLLDEGPVLDRNGFVLAKLFSDYYGCSLGEAIETFLPKALRNDRSSLESVNRISAAENSGVPVKKTVLVHDQTRDRRWAYVIDEIGQTLKAGKRVIVLVPDAWFTQATLAILSRSLKAPIAVFDRKLAPKKELRQWEEIRNGQFDIIVGTRSAVFAPVPDLGMIVIDEEENDSYKQEQSPHYHVHEVAQMRAQTDRCRIIFMSSLPSAETWDRAKKGKWQKVTIGDDSPIKVQVVDMNNYNPRKTSVLSFPLQSEIQRTLEEGGRTVLYMNRLGFTTRTSCQQCGHTLQCERCDVNLTYLYSKKVLSCRHCNYSAPLPRICPACNGNYLRSTGRGVEKLESEVCRLYPQASIAHFDRQTKVFPERANIVIATQAIFRRHDRWNVSLAAILNFDAQLHRMDFRSSEKALSLLVHLKQLVTKKLIIQTRMRDNYCIKAVESGDYGGFYREELKQRKQLDLPPFRHLIALGLRGRQEDIVFEQSSLLYNRIQEQLPKTIEVYEPHADVNPKVRDKYRFTILFKGKKVKPVLSLIKKALKDFKRKGVIVTINVDP